MKRFLILMGCVVSLLTAAPAFAQTEVSLECTWYTSIEFEFYCDDFSFYGYCDAGCDDFDFSLECTASCEAECEALECDVDPGSFDCNAYCEGECGASCSGECGSTSDSAYCEGQCSAYCEGECGASCDITAPDIECEGGCSASCEGSCQAEANFDCHMDCGIDAHIDCTSGWDAEGVLVCNGDVVDGLDWESAMDWLEDHGIEITWEGDADCSGNECYAEGSATIACAATNPGARSQSPSLLSTLIALF